MGSCFADEMGEAMLSHKFQALVNPLGTLFNPLSLSKHLEAVILDRPLSEDGFVERDGLIFHYDLHSSLYAENQDALNKKYEEIKGQMKKQLHGKCLFLTLGTAWVYETLTNKQSVANCHKQAGGLFQKRLLQVEEMSGSLSEVIRQLNKHFPQLHIVLTISPVRHIKDSLSLNAVSKASLLLVCHQLCEKTESLYYFPAYEIMLDELRDYRFYAEDLIHPNEVAVKHIWEKFSESFFSQETQGINRSWAKLSQALSHRALQKESAAHQKFLRTTLQKLQELATNTSLDLQHEIAALQSQIKG